MPTGPGEYGVDNDNVLRNTDSTSRFDHDYHFDSVRFDVSSRAVFDDIPIDLGLLA